MPRIYTHKDLTGLKFGRWTVLKEIEKTFTKKGQSRINYFCRCDCGTERNVLAVYIANGHSQSCGCEKEERRLKALRKPVKQVAGTLQFLSYKRSALGRGYAWGLTQEDVTNIIFSDCHYCGSAPSGTKKNSRGNIISAPVSGIDRVDNNVGYQIGNVVPCCWTCNKAKGSSTHEEFRNWINQLVKHNIKQS